MMQSSNTKSDLDLWPLDPKSIEVLLGSQVKRNEITMQKRYIKFEIPIWPWPFDPEINRGPPRVVVNTYHHFMSKCDSVIMRKRSKLQSTNLTLTFDLLTRKSLGAIFWSWEIHLWSIIIVCQKERELSCGNHFSTDRQTDSYGETSIPPSPQHFGRGGGCCMNIEQNIFLKKWFWWSIGWLAVQFLNLDLLLGT